MSRKGPAVRVSMRIPKVIPTHEDIDASTIQQGMDNATDDTGEDLVFQVHLGTKATVLLVAVLTQIIYTYSGAILQAIGLVQNAPGGIAP